MTTEDQATELYRKHRPQSFKDVVGQASTLRTLASWGKKGEVPHFLLFVGPSGCGKTTSARILREKLQCHDHDFREMNAARERGIDLIRDLSKQVGMSPMAGPCKVYLIDECQQLTPDAQSALLKMLEDIPRHVYWFLATTDPQKLKDTIRTRASILQFRKLKAKELEELAVAVAGKEGREITAPVAGRLAEAADGSARKVLVLLQAALAHADEADQLDAIAKADPQAFGIDIARKLMNNRTRWPDVAPLIEDLEDDAEAVRRIVLGYATSVLVGSKEKNRKPSTNKRAVEMIEAFRDHWYDCGKAGLVASCLEVLDG